MHQNHSFGRSGILQPTALRCVLQDGPVLSQPYVPGNLLRSVTTLTQDDLLHKRTLTPRPGSLVEVKRRSDPQEGSKSFSLKDALFSVGSGEGFFARLGSGKASQGSVGKAAAAAARNRKTSAPSRKSTKFTDKDTGATFYTHTDPTAVSGMGHTSSRPRSGHTDATRTKSEHHRRDRKTSLDSKPRSDFRPTTSKPLNLTRTSTKGPGKPLDTSKTSTNSKSNSKDVESSKISSKGQKDLGGNLNVSGDSKDVRGRSVMKKSTRRRFFTSRPQCAGPDDDTTTEEEEVDGGGGGVGGGGGESGKKWTRSNSLRRHCSGGHSERCLSGSGEPSNSDTDLGKLSAPHSLLDGECGSVGGSSMTSERAIDVGRVGSWATSFEKLLEDPAGLHTFAEFLKKEYSHENIYFWTACERYKRLTSPEEMRVTARQIFERHLYSGAPEPVNVDSQARQDAQDGLHMPNESLFAQAQKQIFNLMKFDSYSRFLKSAVYQECMSQEMRGQPLPYPGGDTLDPDLRIAHQDSHVKLKKSRSDADERRRKSLIPWSRKDRSKSKDRGEADYRRRKKNTQRNTSDSSSLRSDISGSRTSLNSSSDLPMGRRVASRESLTSGDQGSLSGGEGCPMCRVMLPDLTNSVVAIKTSETIQDLMTRLLERRGLSYTTFEVFLHKSDKILNKHEDSVTLGGCEVRLEQRVFFQLDLPSQKTVCVKAKPNKTIADVLKPVLHKYGLKMDLLHIHKSGEEKMINLKATVTDIDAVRLIVQTKEEVKEWRFDSGRQRKRGSGSSSNTSSTLDEITNQVFDDLRNGKTDHFFDDLGVMDLDARSSRTESSDKSSGILGSFSRRNSFGPEKELSSSKGRKPRSSVHDNLALLSHPDHHHHHHLAKRRGHTTTTTTSTPSPLHNKQENDELYEGLKRAQMSRLDDQRGTEINFELPDFLKNDQPQDKSTTHHLAEQLLARLECGFKEGVVTASPTDYFSLAHPEVWGGLPSPPRPPSANNTLVAAEIELDEFDETLRADDENIDDGICGDVAPPPIAPLPRMPLSALPLSPPPPPLPPKPKVGGVRGPPPRPPSRQLHLLGSSNPPPPAFPPPPSSSHSEDEGSGGGVGLCPPPLPPLHLSRQNHHDKFNISFV